TIEAEDDALSQGLCAGPRTHGRLRGGPRGPLQTVRRGARHLGEGAARVWGRSAARPRSAPAHRDLVGARRAARTARTPARGTPERQPARLGGRAAARGGPVPAAPVRPRR